MTSNLTWTSTDGKKINIPLVACGWYDRKLLTFLGSCGTTIAGNPRTSVYWKNDKRRSEEFARKIPRPVLVEVYGTHANIVDIHNQFRQGNIEVERRFKTKRWEVRVFSTLFSICITDAYLAHKFWGSRLLTLQQFKIKLLNSLLDLSNNVNTDSHNTVDTPTCQDGHKIHTHGKLKDLQCFAHLKNKQKRCKVRGFNCQKKAAFYCRVCTPVLSDYMTNETKRDIAFSICTNCISAHQYQMDHL